MLIHAFLLTRMRGRFVPACDKSFSMITSTFVAPLRSLTLMYWTGFGRYFFAQDSRASGPVQRAQFALGRQTYSRKTSPGLTSCAETVLGRKQVDERSSPRARPRLEVFISAEWMEGGS